MFIIIKKISTARHAILYSTQSGANNETALLQFALGNNWGLTRHFNTQLFPLFAFWIFSRSNRVQISDYNRGDYAHLCVTSELTRHTITVTDSRICTVVHPTLHTRPKAKLKLNRFLRHISPTIAALWTRDKRNGSGLTWSGIMIEQIRPEPRCEGPVDGLLKALSAPCYSKSPSLRCAWYRSGSNYSLGFASFRKSAFVSDRVRYTYRVNPGCRAWADLIKRRSWQVHPLSTLRYRMALVVFFSFLGGRFECSLIIKTPPFGRFAAVKLRSACFIEVTFIPFIYFRFTDAISCHFHKILQTDNA